MFEFYLEITITRDVISSRVLIRPREEIQLITKHLSVD